MPTTPLIGFESPVAPAPRRLVNADRGFVDAVGESELDPRRAPTELAAGATAGMTALTPLPRTPPTEDAVESTAPASVLWAGARALLTALAAGAAYPPDG